MRIQSVTFRRDVILYGSYCLPKSVSMELEEHASKWQLTYNFDWQVLECTIIDPRSTQKGTVYVIPRECAQSWVIAQPATPAPVLDQPTKPITSETAKRKTK